MEDKGVAEGEDGPGQRARVESKGGLRVVWLMSVSRFKGFKGRHGKKAGTHDGKGSHVHCIACHIPGQRARVERKGGLWDAGAKNASPGGPRQTLQKKSCEARWKGRPWAVQCVTINCPWLARGSGAGTWQSCSLLSFCAGSCRGLPLGCSWVSSSGLLLCFLPKPAAVHTPPHIVQVTVTARACPKAAAGQPPQGCC